MKKLQLALPIFFTLINLVNSQGLFSLSGSNKQPSGPNRIRPTNNVRPQPIRPTNPTPNNIPSTIAPTSPINFFNPGNPLAGAMRPVGNNLNPAISGNINPLFPNRPQPNVPIRNTNQPANTLRNDLPMPLNLQKINASDTELHLRFRLPDGDESVFNFYIATANIYNRNAEKEVFPVKRDMIEPYGMGTGYLYGNFIIKDLIPGRLYDISIQTQLKDPSSGIEKTSPQRRGVNVITARTLPRKPASLNVIKIDDQPNQVTVNIQTMSTALDGSKFDTVVLQWGELTLDGNLRNIQEQTFLPSNDNSISPIGENFLYEINDLEIGKQYRFMAYTISSVADGPNIDISQSARVQQDYTVGFIGPRLIEKALVTNSSITLAFIGPTVPDVTNYQIDYYKLVPDEGEETVVYNMTIESRYDYPRIMAQSRNNMDFIAAENSEMSGLAEDILIENLPRETALIEGLEPGVLYNIEIRTIRAGKAEQAVSSPSTVMFRTLPGLPRNVRITEIFTKNVTIEWSRPEGAFTTYEFDYKFMSTNEGFDTTYKGVNERSLTLTNLKPGGLYEVNITVYSREGSVIDATRATFTKQLRTTPNAPVQAHAASTMGTIHLKWQAPNDMADVNDWQYKIVYGIARPYNKDEWEEEEVYKEGVKWVASADGAPTREDFLMKLYSGRVYEIRLYTAAGRSTDPIELIKFSKELGPLRVLTQPEQPKFTSTYQLTTRHIKITWQRPKSRYGRFTGYELAVDRRRESRATVDFQRESYNFTDIPPHKTSYVMEVTPGAIYNMTLRTTSGFGDSTVKSIVTSDNKRPQVRVWSPYETHLPFARLSWNFQDCDNIGRLGPDQAQCDISYSRTNLGQVGPMVEVENGIQKWLAPMRGLYRVTARGAGFGTDFGGLGATVSGLFHLDEGSPLKIIVGQRGYGTGNLVSGGAGASYVLTESNKPLVVAGGAGGNDPRMEKKANMSIANARLWQGGNDASEVGIKFGRGGIAGNGGERGALGSGGGAGAYANGDDPSAVGGRDKVKPSRSVFEEPGFYDLKMDEIAIGGLYTEVKKTLAGNEYLSWSHGGFGGGGAGYIQSAGGGGGYSGGAGGPKNGTSGGGGCFLKYTGGMQLATVDNSDRGQVVITLIGLPNEEPIPMTWYLVLSFICGIGLAALCGCLLAWVARCMDFLIPTEEIEQKRQRLILQQAAVDAAKRKIQYEATLKEAQAAALRKKAEQDALDAMRRQRENDENPYYTEQTPNRPDEEYEALSELNRRRRHRAQIESEYYVDQSYHTNLSVDSQEASDIRALGKNFDRSPAASRASDMDQNLIDYYQQKSAKRAPSVLSSIGSFIYGTGKRVNRANGRLSTDPTKKSESKSLSKVARWTEKPKSKQRSVIQWIKPAKRPKPGLWTKPADLNAPRRALSSIRSTSIPSIKDLLDKNFRVREFVMDSDSDISRKIEQFDHTHLPVYNFKRDETTQGKYQESPTKSGKKFAIPSEITSYNPNNVVKATVHKAGTPDSIKRLRLQVATGQKVGFAEKLNMFKHSNIMAGYLKKQDESEKEFKKQKQFKHQVLLPGQTMNPAPEVVNAGEAAKAELLKKVPGGVGMPGMTPGSELRTGDSVAKFGNEIANIAASQGLGAARDAAPDVARAGDQPRNEDDVFLMASNTLHEQQIVVYSEDEYIPKPDPMQSHLPRFKETAVMKKPPLQPSIATLAKQVVEESKKLEDQPATTTMDETPVEPPPLPTFAPVPERNTAERAKVFGGIMTKEDKDRIEIEKQRIEEENQAAKIEEDLDQKGITDPVLRQMFRANSINKSKSSSPTRTKSPEKSRFSESPEKIQPFAIMRHESSHDEDYASSKPATKALPNSFFDSATPKVTDSEQNSPRPYRESFNARKPAPLPEIATSGVTTTGTILSDAKSNVRDGGSDDYYSDASGNSYTKPTVKKTNSFRDNLNLFTKLERTASEMSLQKVEDQVRSLSKTNSPILKRNSSNRIPNMSELSDNVWTGPGNCPPAPIASNLNSEIEDSLSKRSDSYRSSNKSRKSREDNKSKSSRERSYSRDSKSRGSPSKHSYGKSPTRSNHSSPVRDAYGSPKNPNYYEDLDSDPVYENKEAVEARKIAQELIDNNIGLDLDRHRYGKNLIDEAIDEESEEGHQSRQSLRDKLESIGERDKTSRLESIGEGEASEYNPNFEYSEYSEEKRGSAPEITTKSYNPNFVMSGSTGSSSPNKSSPRSCKASHFTQSNSYYSPSRTHPDTRPTDSRYRKGDSDSDNGTVKERSPYSDESYDSYSRTRSRRKSRSRSRSRSRDRVDRDQGGRGRETDYSKSRTGYDSYGTSYTSEREYRKNNRRDEYDSRPNTVDSEDVYSDERSYNDDRTVITHSSEESR